MIKDNIIENSIIIDNIIRAKNKKPIAINIFLIIINLDIIEKIILNLIDNSFINLIIISYDSYHNNYSYNSNSNSKKCTK